VGPRQGRVEGCEARIVTQREAKRRPILAQITAPDSTRERLSCLCKMPWQMGWVRTPWHHNQTTLGRRRCSATRI